MSTATLIAFSEMREALTLSVAGYNYAQREGLLLAPFEIGISKRVFYRYEADMIVAARAAGATKEEMREFVGELLKLREERGPLAAEEVNAVLGARKADADSSRLVSMIRALKEARCPRDAREA